MTLTMAPIMTDNHVDDQLQREAMTTNCCLVWTGNLLAYWCRDLWARLFRNLWSEVTHRMGFWRRFSQMVIIIWICLWDIDMTKGIKLVYECVLYDDYNLKLKNYFNGVSYFFSFFDTHSNILFLYIKTIWKMNMFIAPCKHTFNKKT